MGLDDLVGMRAADKRRELAVRQDRHLDLGAVSLPDPLVLVHGRDAAGVVADHDVRARLLLRHLQLAVDGEGPGELAFRDDVAETETTAIVPGRIVDHLDAERVRSRPDVERHGPRRR